MNITTMNGKETMDTFSLQERIKAIPYWYHKIELPGGIVTPGWAPIHAERYCVPADLSGMRVLDIGAWDGYWTFEALKRGAREAVAIDDFSDTCGTPIPRRGWETFDLCREALGFDVPGDDGWTNEAQTQRVERSTLSVYDISEKTLGRFDLVFFFGTIYHCQHPFLALQKIAEVCDGALYVETASLDEASPYRGGVGHGYVNNDRVMEFYPRAEYCENPTNWWAPTLECLGAMMETVGFHDVEAWPMVEGPEQIEECRGFASGTKNSEICPARHPVDIPTATPMPQAKVAAVMSVPRLGFMDNFTCITESLHALRIPLISIQGAFWGQCLERGLQQLIDSGIDIIVTIDYDTVFSVNELQQVLRLALQHPEAAAIVPVQKGRGKFPLLMSMKTRSGTVRNGIPVTELEAETVPIASGHFGLTALRVEHLLDIPHPWYWDQPNGDGMWGPGRVDADIYFWKKLEEYHKLALLACRVSVGHIEAMINWPNRSMESIYQHTTDYGHHGKPQDAWQ